MSTFQSEHELRKAIEELELSWAHHPVSGADEQATVLAMPDFLRGLVSSVALYAGVSL